jgi:hypothetical protein
MARSSGTKRAGEASSAISLAKSQSILRRASESALRAYPTGQKTRSPHGAQSRKRRSNHDQSKQESRIPGSQGFEDGGLTVECNAFDICPVNGSWRGIIFYPAQLMLGNGG